MRNISQAGVDFLIDEEGLRLEAYDDATGKPPRPGDDVSGTLTIGIGHTGPDVVRGLRITEEEACRLLDRDLDETEAAVERLVRVPVNENEFAALVAFAFNTGAPAFRASTLLRLINAGDRSGAAGQFLRWDKTTIDGRKVVSDGLTARRAREAALFATPVTSPEQAIPRAPSTVPAVVAAPTPTPTPLPIPASRTTSPPVADAVPDKTPTTSLTLFGIGLGALSEFASWVAEQSQSLQETVPWLGTVFVVATVAGFALAAYGRLRLMKTEGV